nr:unnamed protein product [Callosobruchus analis]
MDDNTPVLENYYLRPDSQIYTTQLFSDYYMVKAVHKTSQTNKIVQVDVGKWIRSAKKFATFEAISIYRDRSDLMGLELNMTYVATSNETLNHLEDYSYILSSITGTQCFYTDDRIDYVDFVPASTPTYFKFIFRAPPLSYVTNIFTLPFDAYVWYCTVALIAVIFFVIYAIAVWEWKDPVFKRKLEKMESASTPALRPKTLDVAVLEIGAITQQGTDTEPKSISGRIATLITLLALMFLYTSYSANIVALLQSTTESIKTLEDILNSRITLGVHDVVYGHYYFEHATEPTRRAIYEQKVAPKGQKPHFMTVEEGIARVRKEFFGFSGEVSSSYKIVADTFEEHEKCSLKEVIFITPVDTHMPIRKKSAYKEFVKVGSLQILHSGIQRREENRIYTKKPVCHSKGSNFDSVGLIDCYAAFLIFAIGVALSLTMFLLEQCSKRHRSRQDYVVDLFKENMK